MRYSECYFDEPIDDRFYVGMRPDSDDGFHYRDWCDENIGLEDVEWGMDYDEFYSPLSQGFMFWFLTDRDRILFRLRWAPEYVG